MTKITLPPLPRPDAVTEIYTGHGYRDVWTATTVRAIQIEAARAALEAAAEVCDEAALTTEPDDFALDAVDSCAVNIRAIKIEGETP